ncbi:hypothetical protein GCM10027168_50720 [Streptomyces capparidis]
MPVTDEAAVHHGDALAGGQGGQARHQLVAGFGRDGVEAERPQVVLERGWPAAVGGTRRSARRRTDENDGGQADLTP